MHPCLCIGDLPEQASYDVRVKHKYLFSNMIITNADRISTHAANCTKKYTLYC